MTISDIRVEGDTQQIALLLRQRRRPTRRRGKREGKPAGDILHDRLTRKEGERAEGWKGQMERRIRIGSGSGRGKGRGPLTRRFLRFVET